MGQWDSSNSMALLSDETLSQGCPSLSQQRKIRLNIAVFSGTVVFCGTITPMSHYRYNEDKLLAELKEYIDETYGQHYSQNKYQATDFIIDAGHGEGFCIGNVLKYAQRYGKKGGKNRKDILKVLHYALIWLYVHDQNDVV